MDGAHRIHGPVQMNHQPAGVRYIYALRFQARFVNVSGTKLRSLQSSLARHVRCDCQVIFVQVDPGGMRAFAGGPSRDVAQATAKLHETVPRTESGPPQQFASAAVVNGTDNAQTVVVASSRPK